MTYPVVTVVGAGNVGCALAAHLALLGVEVRLCTRSDARLAPIREAGAITVTGAVSGTVTIPRLTTSLPEAVEGADVVAVTVPRPALPYYAASFAEVLSTDQLLWLNPGNTGGALYLAAQLERHGGPHGLPVCQLSTSSHGARMVDPTTVGVFRLGPASLAAFPATRLEECFMRIDALLPGLFTRAQTMLDVDLMNINAVMHPALMVCNAGWVETADGDFCIYPDGASPAVGRVMDAVDRERLLLAERLGVAATPFVELLRQSRYITAEEARTGQAYQALQAAAAIREVKAPPTLDHRYLHEDVGWGLVPWMEMASSTGLATPTMTALTHLAGVMNKVDYRAIGLTLERMGLLGKRPEQILDYVRYG